MDVVEYGTVNLKIAENGEVYAENYDTDNSDSGNTNLECPECNQEINTSELIVTENPTQQKTTYKIGDIVNIKTLKNTKGKIKQIYGETAVEIIITNGKYRGKSLNYNINLIEKVDKTIDNGESENIDLIIERDEEEYTLDPIINMGAICPKCKHLFASNNNQPIINNPNIFGQTRETNDEVTICPKCLHEFNRTKELQKIINNKGPKN
jgi:hypothetical protein